VGAGLGVLEKTGAFVGVVAELVAKDAEGVGGITEAESGLGSGQVFDKVGAEGLVLAVVGRFRGEEEAGILRDSYLVSSIDRHVSILSHYLRDVNRWRVLKVTTTIYCAFHGINKHFLMFRVLGGEMACFINSILIMSSSVLDNDNTRIGRGGWSFGDQDRDHNALTSREIARQLLVGRRKNSVERG
jgi:hypothetical protein